MMYRMVMTLKSVQNQPWCNSFFTFKAWLYWMTVSMFMQICSMCFVSNYVTATHRCCGAVTLFPTLTFIIGTWESITCSVIPPGPLFNIKMPSYQYRKSHCGDKTVVRSSCVHNGISYTGKMTFLYWITALGPKLEGHNNSYHKISRYKYCVQSGQQSWAF